MPFIAIPKEEWNDLLNHYLMPLGEYDFKRMLFAKEILYTEDEFNCMFKFVIVRNPYDRIVSAWKYEYRNHLKSPLNLFLKPKRTITKYSFERYLKLIPEVWKTKSKRHFAMHCAPIWSDITDWNGNVLVDRIYKLEDISEDIDELRSKLELQHIEINHLNRNRGDNSYRQYYNRTTRGLVEELFKDDITNLGYEF